MMSIIAVVLHIATVHFKSARWIPIQIRELRRNINVPFEMWTSLEGVDPSLGIHFDHVVDQRGPHDPKLNDLARRIVLEADPEDLLMFLDGDAFPLVDPLPLIERGLNEAPLLAVRRAENGDELHPHPCFCVTHIATWRRLSGSWSGGGTMLRQQLELNRVGWTQVLRCNRRNLHPLFFGVYGNTVYHHGAGFRKPLSRVDLEEAGALQPSLESGLSLHSSVRQRMDEIARRNAKQSEEVLERIERNDSDWLMDVTGLSSLA
jgi:hypothetical protein